MPIKQDQRMIAITTPLGKDVLGLRSFSFQEQMGRLFQIEADLSGEKDFTVDFDKIVGHEVTVRLNLRKGGGSRSFHGIVSRMVQSANENDYCHYRVTIVPWLWFLTRTSDCRIFQNKTIPQIIEAVFKGHGFSGGKDYKLNLIGNYQPWEFCVQYRETDFNFVSRLMEQEGIYYFFEYNEQENTHTLMLVDDLNSHKPLPNKEIPFQPTTQGAVPAPYAITDWTMEKEVQPVATALQDFNFEKPKLSLLAKDNVTRKYGGAKYEIYDYPGEYEAHADGMRYASVRLEELQTQYETLHGQASARSLAPGCTFKLKNHPRTDQEREYLITGISLHADAGEFASSGDAPGTDLFSCNFTCIDKTQQFRPARLTPKPVIQGVQTAIVTGPAGQEIHVDKYGRVKLHFHWDRHDKSDENSSCWVRVSQAWTGKGWGHIANPHMGEEVIVAFLEGDPDRPIVVGRVYNEDHMPPYPLPASAAIIGMKTASQTTTGICKVGSKT